MWQQAKNLDIFFTIELESGAGIFQLRFIALLSAISGRNSFLLFSLLYEIRGVMFSFISIFIYRINSSPSLIFNISAGSEN